MTDNTVNAGVAHRLYTEGEKIADTKAPAGPIAEKWTTRKFEAALVNPANRRKLSVIIVGTGLAGGAAAATLGEAGYHVKSFCFQDSPRRAHSIAAQGGINAAKNYKEDGDSVYRLFYDTVKGGDYRARETNVYRLAEVSAAIIDQCVAQGVPFAREYGGLLDNRSFGGVQVSRTFYARGQTGQQLLIGAYQALERQVAAGTVEQFTRHEMLEVIVSEGRARGIIARDLVTGEIETHLADAVVLASGGYGNVFFLSTNAMGSNVTASWRAHRKGAYMANPCYTQIHPTCIPVSGDHQSKLTLMSESLRNDGRIWVPKRREDCDKDPAHHRRGGPRLLPGADLPELRQPRAARHRLAPGQERLRRGPRCRPYGRGLPPWGVPRLHRRHLPTGQGRRRGQVRQPVRHVRPDHRGEPVRDPDAHLPGRPLRRWVVCGSTTTSSRLDPRAVRHRRGQLLRPRRQPPGCLGAHAGPGRRVLRPAEHHPRLPRQGALRAAVDRRPRRRRGTHLGRGAHGRLLQIQGERSVDSFHKELGHIMWEYCGMERSEEGLLKAIDLIRGLREEFWRNVRVLGSADTLNQSLEKAGRVADFLELGELMCIDALHRRESCGGHFRAESQTEDGEALRHDDEFLYVAAWEFAGGDGDGEMGAPGAPQGGPGVRSDRTEAAELQVTTPRSSTFLRHFDTSRGPRS
jgi:succinate dehydrogenase / fumarate reductase flavoprotein subunit